MQNVVQFVIKSNFTAKIPEEGSGSPAIQGRFSVQKAAPAVPASEAVTSDSTPSPAGSSPYTTASESVPPVSQETTSSNPRPPTSPSLSLPDSISSVSTTATSGAPPFGAPLPAGQEGDQMVANAQQSQAAAAPIYQPELPSQAQQPVAMPYYPEQEQQMVSSKFESCIFQT